MRGSPGSLLYYWKYAVTFSFKDEKVKFEVDKLIFEEKGSAGSRLAGKASGIMIG